MSRQILASCRAEGDAKLQELRRRLQGACGPDAEEPGNEEREEQVRRAEDRWRSFIQSSKEALERAERRRALSLRLRDFSSLSDATGAWLEEQQQSLNPLDSQTDPGGAVARTQVSRRRPGAPRSPDAEENQSRSR